MSEYRPSVRRQTKLSLVAEAGSKCANPGCSAWRTHIHHIREWAVYQSHDAAHMIAICPTCHDAVHHGAIEINDQTLYAWKQIRRPEAPSAHVYVEPGQESKLLLGSIAVTGQTGVSVFNFGPSNRLSFRLVDGDIMQLNLAVSTTDGNEVLRVVDGYVRHDAEEPVEFTQVPGHVRLTAPSTELYAPSWALEKLRVQEPGFAGDGRLALLDLEVLEPGLVRVQGVWTGSGHAVIISKERLAFVRPDLREPISMMGAGAETVLNYAGPIDTSLFSIGGSPGALRIPERAGPKPGRNEPCPCGSGRKFKRCHGA